MQTHQCPTNQELGAFDLGNLVGERYEEVSLHLESCTECARRFETLVPGADGLIENLRQELPSAVLFDDSELRRLMDSAAALQDTSVAAEAETHSTKRVSGRPSHEQLAEQLLSPPQAEGELGRLGGYRVLEVLGAGGMGVVFKAEDPGLKRLVALKAILPHVADASDASKERFLREARATASIQHDNIVTIHQVGQDGDVAFLAMQLLEGESLSKRLSRQPRLPIEDVLQIARETAQGLAAAHAKGLTHRDIKPDNLWLESVVSSQLSVAGDLPTPTTDHEPRTTDIRVKILDFGLARAADNQRELTQEGMVVGTPSYLAPEQARGERVDARADLFSLGVVMYQMLTGSKPFQRDSLMATLLAITNDTPLPLVSLRDDVPPALAELVMRLLAKDPAQRPASANEVVRAIRGLEAKTPEPVVLPAAKKAPPSQRTFIVAGAIALALLAGIIVIIRNKKGEEIVRIEAPDGSTVETTTNESTKPVVPVPPDTALKDHLPPMSPIALVQRPAKLVAKDGEPVASWTIAPAAVPTFVDDGMACALKSDGQRLATFGEDGHVRIWDLEFKRLDRVLLGHAGGPAWNSPASRTWDREVTRRFGLLAWQPESSVLASVSRDGTVKVWDVQTGRTAFEHAGAAGDANMVAWSPDGSKLAVACRESHMVRIWTTTDWKELKPLDGRGDRPKSLMWSPDSTILAVCTRFVVLYSPLDSKLRVIDGATVADSRFAVPPLRWSPDGAQLAHFMGSRVAIRDAKSLDLVRELRHDVADSKPLDFAWSPNGRQILIDWRAANKDAQTIHEVTTGEVVRSLEVAGTSHDPNLRYVEWLPDGRAVVINAQLVDVDSQAVLGDFNNVYDWSDDGKRLLVWERSTGSPRVVRFDKPGEKPATMFAAAATDPPTRHVPAWSPDGRHMKLGPRSVVSSNDTGGFGQFLAPKQDIYSWSPDNARIFRYTSSSTPSLSTWPGEELLREFKLPFNVGQHVWSPDATKIAIAEHNGHSLLIVDIASGETLASWKMPPADWGGSVSVLDWVGDQIAIGVLGGDAKASAAFIYSVKGELIHALQSGGYGGFVGFLPGGKQVLRCAKDAMFLYDAADGRLLRKFPVGVTRDAVHFIDDTTVLCASPDGTINRLNLTTGTNDKLSRFAGEAKLFSPDGRFLICDLANVRRIIRVADGELLVSIPAHLTLVSPDGHLLNRDKPRGAAWATSPGVKDTFVYIVQTASGQQTLTPAEFANRYGWQNDPGKVRLKSEDESSAPAQPVAATLAAHLPPMSPIALVERPAKLTAKQGEAVESWTLATAQLPWDSFFICALRPDGKRLATFHEDGHVRIWDPDLKRLEKLLVGHTGGAAWASLPAGSWWRTNSRRFGPLAWHPQGAWLASVSRDGSLRVWDVASGRVAFQQSAAPGDLNMVAWSPDGAQLAAGCLVSQSVRIWTTADWKEQKTLDGLGASPSNLLWSPDSRTLAVGAKTVVMYAPQSGEVHGLSGAQVAHVLSGSPSVRWSPDGKQLAHRTGTSVVICDAKTLNRIREIRKAGAATASVRDFAWSPDGRQVLIGWADANKASQTIHDVATGEISRTLADAPSSGIYRDYLEWLPDGRTAAINGKLVDLETQAVLELELVTSDRRGAFHHFCEWSDDGRRIVLYKTNDSRPYVMRLDTPNKPVELYSPSHMAPPTSNLAAWSPDGRHLNLGRARRVFSFDVEGAFARFVSPSRDIGSWSPNGTQTLSSVVSSQTPAICQWPSGEVVREFKLPFHVGSHAWSPDGSKIAISAQQGHAVKVLSTTSGETLSEWTVPSISGSISCLDWHGDRIAIGVTGAAYNKDSACHICSARDGSTIYSLPGEESGHLVRWLPEGMQLLRYGKSDKTSLYDAADGRLLREFPIGVHAVHFVDKETLFCGSTDGTIQRLNAASGASEIISRFVGEAKLFSPDGAFLLCDLANVRRIVRVADGQTVLAIADSGLLVGPDGHLIANPLPKGSLWATSTGVKDSVVYVVQTASGQQTLTPAEFANKYGWQNDPDKVRLK